ncbi:MAG: hypothetical protein OXI97_12120 [Acidimicrobiaceae bacterium]|nr:hypothetical protein [Acidimicrobiaceae bacterium]
MSEEDRSRLYAWVREATDEQAAEYLMSCLPTAPMADLVTKDYLETVLAAEFSKFALMLAEQREADRAEQAAQRETDRETYLAQSARQFRWLIGTFIALTGVLMGAVYGAVAIA